MRHLSRHLRRHLIAAAAAAVLLAGCADTTDPQALLAAARTAVAQNDHATAIIQLKNALQRDLNLAEARFLLGTSLLATGDAAGAVVEFRRARELKHPESEVAPMLALAMLAQGQFKPVTDEFGAASLDNPAAQADLLVTVAQAYIGRGLLDEVAPAVDAALRARPGHPGASVLRARLLANQRDYDGAFALLDTVLAAQPRHDGALVFRGDLLGAVRGDLDGALAAYRSAIAANPRNVEAHTGALALLFSRNEVEPVKAQLEQMRRTYPQHLQTRFFEAQLAFMERDFARAREIVLALIKLAPDNVRLLQLAGAIELQGGSPLQAETYLARALQLAPDLVMARRLLTQSYLASGQPEPALQTLAPLLRAANPDAVTLALAAEAHLLAGNMREATEHFSRAARLNPQDIRSRSVVALADVRAGRVDDGFEQLKALAAGDQAGTTADLALISARLLRREYPQALEAIAALEQKQPGRPLAHNLRGRVQLALNERDAARASFEQALKVDPAYFPAAAALASLDFDPAKPDAARAHFRSILARDPRHVPALLGLVEISARSGGTKDELTRLLTDAVNAAPAAPRPRLMLIEHLLRHTEPRAALAQAQSGVAAQPNSPELLDALGRAQLANNDGQQALATFSRLASQQPRAPLPLLRVASAQRALNNNDAARRSLTRALELAPNFLPAQQELIALEVATRRHDAAVAIARTVQRQRPNDASGLILEGDIRAAQGQFAVAAAAYRGALAKAPGHAETAVKLHAMLRGANRMADAERFATDWLRERPRDARFRMHLGDIATFLNDYPSAEQHYRAALAIAPENAITLNNIAWTMARQGKAGAVEYAERALRLAPDQPAIMDTLGYALSQAGQHARAIEVQRRAVAAQPGTHLYKLTLAHIYIQAGRRSEATRTLDELTALGERFPDQAAVERLREQLRGG